MFDKKVKKSPFSLSCIVNFFLMRFSKSKGTTLVEILVAMSIFGIVTLGIAEFFRNTERTKKKLYVKRIMQHISQDIYHKISDPFSLYLSLRETDNADLINCVYGGSSGCSFDSPQNYQGFSLSFQSSRDTTQYAAGPVTDETGTNSSSICYDTDGALCSCENSLGGSGASCAFIAETYFYASCEDSGASAPCEKGASVIHVAYKVRQKEGSLKSFGRAMNSLPAREFYVHHPLESLFDPRFNSECNTGAVIVGFGKNGAALCECAGNYIATGYENRRGPICELDADDQDECPPNTVPGSLTGTHRVECLDFEDAYDCMTSDGNSVSGDICPDGYWLQSYYRKSCKFHCTIDSWSGGECLNESEKTKTADNKKVGFWCYNEPNAAENVTTTDEKICCRRLFSP